MNHDKTKSMKVHIGGVDNCYGPVVGPEGKHHNGYAFTFEQLQELITKTFETGAKQGNCHHCLHQFFIENGIPYGSKK